ncbi:CpsD/CapB family tyrosine-protein kinase [Mobilitalea sibirica]|uniref:non-specific protein-tyrosine kinase n=1 Tax=Mobilitalea sibirica TaxID=1462919 RepID=A0A8J7KZ48_9FIRM|nr:CpsD/CapB family tyrosine-protein kinase [Mobilitalea sibirica]MBH1939363.1 CpsD/CapB family tyrosine-protein kinase [Mobilitalea sibirica]
MLQVNFENINQLSFLSNEAYKSLRTNIQFCGSEIKVICITSCLPNEGKSNVSFNLAMSMAESGKEVIFIDADLRRSVIVGRYKPDREVLGLTHYLSGQNSLEDVLYKSNIDNLDMIFTGPIPPNPAELLGSDNFIDLIKMFRNIYDYIIIDTPPIGSVIDSAIVAEQCDGIVMVIEANAISYKFAQRTIKQLEKAHSRILGAVLNKYESNKKAYGYKGKKYKRYYRYYESY